VTITLEPAEGGTTVRLVHSGLTPEQAAATSRAGTTTARGSSRRPSTATPVPDEWAASEPGDPLTAVEASLAVCQAVLRGLRPEDGGARTPCDKFTVDDLVEHLLGSLRSLGRAGGATVPDPGSGPQKSGSRMPLK